MSNDKASLEYEASQTIYPMQALTDSGDQTIFTTSATLFSEADGVAPDIRPNGVITGGAVIPAVSLTNNAVDVAALTCYLAGVLTSVSADTDVTITRPATAVSKVNSITINTSGAVAVVAGTDGTTTAFSETRGAAGAPPYIPVGSIEIAQVRVTSNTAAPITAAQIYAIAGTHLERYDVPAIEYIGDKETGDAKIKFVSALPKIHTGDTPKPVYGSYAQPIFTEIKLSNDFVPSDYATSVSSTQVYNGAVNATSKSLGQASFKAVLKDGITDPILAKTGQTLWFRFKQDRFKTPHILTQGVLSVGRTFSASNNPEGSFTISSMFKSINKPL